MTTLISKIGNFQVHILEKPSLFDDGIYYDVLETNFRTYNMERALKNAQMYLKKLRGKFKKSKKCTKK